MMLVTPSTVYVVVYRNADGILRDAYYYTPYHAEQFARALKLNGLTEIHISRRRNS